MTHRNPRLRLAFLPMVLLLVSHCAGLTDDAETQEPVGGPETIHVGDDGGYWMGGVRNEGEPLGGESEGEPSAGGTSVGGGTGGSYIDSCLSEDTPVSTAMGLVKIGDLKVGDRVWSLDPQGGALRLNPVTHIRKDIKALHLLEMSDGREIKATATHPFFDLDRGDWVQVSELGSEARLLSPSLVALTNWKTSADGSTLAWHSESLGLAEMLDFGVEASISEPVGSGVVVDISVARDHNFVANGIVVHNKSGGSPSCDSWLRFLEPELIEGDILWTEFESGERYSDYYVGWNQADSGSQSQMGTAGQGGSSTAEGPQTVLKIEHGFCTGALSFPVSVTGVSRWEYAFLDQDDELPDEWVEVTTSTAEVYRGGEGWPEVLLRFSTSEFECIAVGAEFGEAACAPGKDPR